MTQLALDFADTRSQSVPYTLVRSRRRTLAIEVGPAGHVTVRAPQRITLYEIDSFYASKRNWVARKVREARKRHGQTPERRYEDGEMFPFRGRQLTIRTRSGSRDSATLVGDCLELVQSLPSTTTNRRQTVKDWLRRQASSVIPERVDGFWTQVGEQPRSIRIRFNRGRWGSCNKSRKSLNFNALLLMAPDELLDYVIVHELCHLIRADHSPAFWSHVERVMPDYVARQRCLRDLEPQLVL